MPNVTKLDPTKYPADETLEQAAHRVARDQAQFGVAEGERDQRRLLGRLSSKADKYTAETFGSFPAISRHPTIKAARAWAEDYGSSANTCTITDKTGKVVGVHTRDTSGDGMRWFRATFTS